MVALHHRTPGRAGTAEGGEAAPAARPIALDRETSKGNGPPSDEGGAGWCVGYKPGRLHPSVGKGDRVAVLDQIRTVADAMECPGLLTLTVNRAKFRSPRHAHAVIGKRLRGLLRRAGFTGLWFRVTEFQTRSGEGWPHVHVLVDLGDLADLRTPRPGKPDFIDYGAARARVLDLWCRRWSMASSAACDLEVLRGGSRAAVSYVAKYLVKGHEALPVWVLAQRRAPRMLGYSKAAGVVLRAAGLTTTRPRVPDDPLREKRPRGRGLRVVDRLAAANLRVSIVSPSGRFLTQVWGNYSEVMVLASRGMVPGLRVERGLHGLVIRTESWVQGAAAVVQIVRRLQELGVCRRAVETFRRHREEWLHSWATMQATAAPLSG